MRDTKNPFIKLLTREEQLALEQKLIEQGILDRRLPNGTHQGRRRNEICQNRSESVFSDPQPSH